MTLTRWCGIFVLLALLASLTASLAGHPESWWWLMLLFGSAAASYLTRTRPFKGMALALLALDAALLVAWDMCQDAWITFKTRYAGRWGAAKADAEEWE